jgi:hypothetical protein
MTKRTRAVLWLLEAAFVLTAVYFEPTLTVRGKLHGEAFFDGKSTSWWRRELENWDMLEFKSGRGPMRAYTWTSSYLFVRSPTWFEQCASDWFGLDTDTNVPTPPKLLRGDPMAAPVLEALRDDPNSEVQRMVRYGLDKIEPREELGRAEESP